MILISTVAILKDGKLARNLDLNELKRADISWYWVDFCDPNDEEVALLHTHFKFHHLAIEDCLYFLQRPKVDYYDEYNFFVLHALDQHTLSAEEVDLFVGNNMIVTFHFKELQEIVDAREHLSNTEEIWNKGYIYGVYLIINKIVGQYFPVVYRIEDKLDEFDNIEAGYCSRSLVEDLFNVRGELLKLRRTVVAMRDLLYRVLNSTHLNNFNQHKVYFSDIYDHLLKLADMIEANRDITSDIRDSYISINSDRMNTIVTVLTVMTTIFAPLTFIVGVYGMNFKNMPELNLENGYYIVLLLMIFIGIIMFIWFKKKGWFDFYK